MTDEPAVRRPAGELEATVLSALWAAAEPLTPGAIRRAVGGGLARTTIATILARLHEKGAVTRARAGRGYVYSPAEDAAGLAARRMRSTLESEPDRSTVLARFVSGLSGDDEQELRRLLGEAPDEPGERAL